MVDNDEKRGGYPGSDIGLHLLFLTNNSCINRGPTLVAMRWLDWLVVDFVRKCRIMGVATSIVYQDTAYCACV